MGRPISVPVNMHNSADCVISFRVTCLMFTFLWHILFFSLSFLALHQLQRLSELQQTMVLLQFPLLDVVIAMDANAVIVLFIFRILCCLCPLARTWSGSMHTFHIALQELQEVWLMLHTMACYLSAKEVALHLDNSTT